LSRFQSDAEKKKVVAGLADGGVDVVVGTHRLFSDQIAFKDLGLVIIDEEQRFGVEHKEALKKLRLNVDVLSMSATPIPRTLEMAITGIREMSVIATPPEERHPVLTFAGPYDSAQVRASIRRELAREGQAFYIHNRVASIEKTAQQIAELVPEARVAVAHGQMNEHTLEQVMVDFWERRFDVLVCTTIVEAGLDIDPVAFAATVMATLNDPRGWGADGSVSFARTDGEAQVRVVLASPDTVDDMCAPLNTRGIYSCGRYGHAALNHTRWVSGADEFTDMTQYRQYLVNHEVGHLLGRQHVQCPAAGQVAPIMQQQTISVAPCLPNGWPFPDAG